MKRILVVEDEVAISDILRNYLVDAGYEVIVAHDGLEGYATFEKQTFDLVMLDVMMPKIDGFVLLEMIRKISNVPVMMITAMSDVPDQIRAFEQEVDDYITKPFDMKLVLVRVASLLRRSQVVSEKKDNGNKLYYADLTVDKGAFEVFKGDVKLELTHKEFEILCLLLKHQNKVFTRENLLEQLWGYDFFGNPKVVNVHIQNLRKKLDGDYIETVRGVGYKIGTKN